METQATKNPTQEIADFLRTQRIRLSEMEVKNANAARIQEALDRVRFDINLRGDADSPAESYATKLLKDKGKLLLHNLKVAMREYLNACDLQRQEAEVFCTE